MYVGILVLGCPYKFVIFVCGSCTWNKCVNFVANALNVWPVCFNGILGVSRLSFSKVFKDITNAQ